MASTWMMRNLSILVLERAEETVKLPMRNIMVDEKMSKSGIHIWTRGEEEEGLERMKE